MREIIVVAVIVAICLVRGYGGEEEKPASQNATPEIKVPADDLQRLFLKLTPKTTREEFENYISSTQLYMNKDNYEYKVAFRESDAYFKRGTSGDAVTVSFTKDWNLNIGEYFYSDTLCYAYVISGKTPDAKASYKFKDGWTGEQKESVSALTALWSAVNHKKRG